MHGSVLLPALFIAIALGAVCAVLYLALYLPVYLGVMLAKEKQPMAFYQKHLAYSGAIVVLNLVIPVSFFVVMFLLVMIGEIFGATEYFKSNLMFIETFMYSKPVDLIEKAYNRVMYTLFGLLPLFLIGCSAKASFSYSKAK